VHIGWSPLVWLVWAGLGWSRDSVPAPRAGGPAPPDPPAGARRRL